MIDIETMFLYFLRKILHDFFQHNFYIGIMYIKRSITLSIIDNSICINKYVYQLFQIDIPVFFRRTN